MSADPAAYPRPTVSLTRPEQFFAAQAGAMRRINAINRKRSEPLGTGKGDRWERDIEAAGAEAAVAKYLDRYWLSVAAELSALRGDVGRIQVRWSPRPDARLIVHDTDPDAAPFVLVVGRLPDYELVGWIMGREAKLEKYIFGGDGRSAYFVPATDLQPIATIAHVA